MNNLTTLKTLTEALASEIASYENRPTKACSLRIRKLTQQLNNIGPSIRKELVAADKVS